MINVELDTQNAIAMLAPDAALSEQDFKSVANIVDPFIEQHGQLKGLLITAASFPGWQSLAGLLSHLHFVKEHHKKVQRVALVTDSPLGNVAETIASHFVAAEVKAFAYGDLAKAKQWLLSEH
jgi:hypothetical protein